MLGEWGTPKASPMIWRRIVGVWNIGRILITEGGGKGRRRYGGGGMSDKGMKTRWNCNLPIFGHYNLAAFDLLP